MSIKCIFQFESLDSTRSLNQRSEYLFEKGVYHGGEVEPVGSQNQVVVHPFNLVSKDGMHVVSDTDEYLPVGIGDYYVVCRARYIVDDSPEIQLTTIKCDTFDSWSEADRSLYTKFAKASSSGFGVSVDVSCIETITSVGRNPYRGYHASAADLYQDVANCHEGDFAMVKSDDTTGVMLYVYANNQWHGYGSATNVDETIRKHRSNLDFAQVHNLPSENDVDGNEKYNGAYHLNWNQINSMSKLEKVSGSEEVEPVYDTVIKFNGNGKLQKFRLDYSSVKSFKLVKGNNKTVVTLVPIQSGFPVSTNQYYYDSAKGYLYIQVENNESYELTYTHSNFKRGVSLEGEYENGTNPNEREALLGNEYETDTKGFSIPSSSNPFVTGNTPVPVLTKLIAQVENKNTGKVKIEFEGMHFYCGAAGESKKDLFEVVKADGSPAVGANGLPIVVVKVGDAMNSDTVAVDSLGYSVNSTLHLDTQSSDDATMTDVLVSDGLYIRCFVKGKLSDISLADVVYRRKNFREYDNVGYSHVIKKFVVGSSVSSGVRSVFNPSSVSLYASALSGKTNRTLHITRNDSNHWVLGSFEGDSFKVGVVLADDGKAYIGGNNGAVVRQDDGTNNKIDLYKDTNGKYNIQLKSNIIGFTSESLSFSSTSSLAMSSPSLTLSGTNVNINYGSSYTGSTSIGNKSGTLTLLGGADGRNITLNSSGIGLTGVTNINTSGSATTSIGNANTTSYIYGTVNIGTTGSKTVTVGNDSGTVNIGGNVTVGSVANTTTVRGMYTNVSATENVAVSGKYINIGVSTSTADNISIGNGSSSVIVENGKSITLTSNTTIYVQTAKSSTTGTSSTVRNIHISANSGKHVPTATYYNQARISVGYNDGTNDKLSYIDLKCKGASSDIIIATPTSGNHQIKLSSYNSFSGSQGIYLYAKQKTTAEGIRLESHTDGWFSSNKGIVLTTYHDNLDDNKTSIGRLGIGNDVMQFDVSGTYYANGSTPYLHLEGKSGTSGETIRIESKNGGYITVKSVGSAIRMNGTSYNKEQFIVSGTDNGSFKYRMALSSTDILMATNYSSSSTSYVTNGLTMHSKNTNNPSNTENIGIKLFAHKNVSSGDFTSFSHLFLGAGEAGLESYLKTSYSFRLNAKTMYIETSGSRIYINGKTGIELRYDGVTKFGMYSTNITVSSVINANDGVSIANGKYVTFGSSGGISLGGCTCIADTLGRSNVSVYDSNDPVFGKNGAYKSLGANDKITVKQVTAVCGCSILAGDPSFKGQANGYPFVQIGALTYSKLTNPVYCANSLGVRIQIGSKLYWMKPLYTIVPES